MGSKKKFNLGTKISWGIGIIFAALVGSHFAPSSPTHTFFCEHPLFMKIASSTCEIEFQHISPELAEMRLMHYFSKTGAPGEAGAWDNMLTEERKLEVKLPKYTKYYAPYAWAEVISTPKEKEDQRNVFEVKVRFYKAAEDENPRWPRMGEIEEKILNVGLRNVDGKLLVNDEEERKTPTITPTKYPYPSMPEPHPTYHSALVDHESGALLETKQRKDEGRLSILCKLDENSEVVKAWARSRSHTLGEDKVDKWYRTPDGWLPALAMPDFQANNVPNCNPRYAEARY